MSEPANTLPRELADGYRSALMAAIKEIFASMLGERIFQTADRTTATPHVSSLIGMAGKFSDVVMLHFSESAACKIASGLLGMPLEELDETVRDAIAELANMVAGGFKRALSRAGE